jgi:hypothetical protein
MLRTIETHIYKSTALVVAFGLVSFLLSTAARAQTNTAKPPALASADWSVKSTHSLASNPPSADVVQTFVNAAFGSDHVVASVCAFRFVDLRHSGNLSLVTVLNSGWYQCNGIDIFDKTASGFAHYSTDAHTNGAGYSNQGFSSEDLADSIQDVNHDGNFVLVLFGAIGSSETNCQWTDWPMIFGWNGSTYSDVSSQHRGYYEKYMKTLRAKMGGEWSNGEEAPATVRTPASQPTRVAGFQHGAPNYYVSAGPDIVSMGGGHGGGMRQEQSLSPTAAPSPDAQEYECDAVGAAKAEAFLGIHSDTTMNYAIKAYESNDPERRELAAVILSFIGTREAAADLKELTNDSDPDVAKVAKERLSRPDPDPEDYRVTEDAVFDRPARKQ